MSKWRPDDYKPLFKWMLSGAILVLSCSLFRQTEGHLAPPGSPAASGLVVSLYEDADSAPGLLHPWPRWHEKPAGGYSDEREQVVTVVLADGRRFSHWSHSTNVQRFHDKIDSIVIHPAPGLLSLAGCDRTVRAILDEWKLQPVGDVATLLHQMADAIPTQGPLKGPSTGTKPTPADDYSHYWLGGQAGMKINGEAEIFVSVRLDMSPDTQGYYNVSLEFCATQEWYASQLHAAARPTTLPVRTPSDRLDISLRQGADSNHGIKEAWPKTFNRPDGEWDIPEERLVTVKIPNGRSFTCVSHGIGIGRSNDQITYVRVSPAAEVRPLWQTSEELEKLLAEWMIEPREGLAELIHAMRRQIPRQNSFMVSGFTPDGKRDDTWTIGNPTLSAMSAARGRMEIDKDVVLEVEVRPLLSSVDRYTLSVLIGTLPK